MPNLSDVLPNSPVQYPQNQVVNLATTQTPTANIPPEVSDFFGNYIGMIAKKRCVLHYLATETTLPLKSGTSFIIPTFRALDDSTIPYIEEGKTPAGKDLQRVQMKLTPKQLGNYVTISDVAVLTVQDSTLQHAAMLLGINLATACDKIIAQAWDQITKSQYATGGGGSSAQNPGYITQDDILTASNQLKLNNAYLVSPNMFGSQIYGSTPVSEAFYCFANTKIEPDLYNIPAFAPLAKYGSSAAAHWLAGEVGECLNVRFVLSNNLPEQTSGDNATADKPYLKNFILGRFAYYTTTLGMRSSEFIFGSTGFDPLRQRFTVAYKAWFGCAVNDAHDWIIRLVCRTRATV